MVNLAELVPFRQTRQAPLDIIRSSHSVASADGSISLPTKTSSSIETSLGGVLFGKDERYCIYHDDAADMVLQRMHIDVLLTYIRYCFPPKALRVRGVDVVPFHSSKLKR
jgi:hypothetical protein